MTVRNRKKWEVTPRAQRDELLPLKELGISPLTTQILYNRGVTDMEHAKRFLSPALSDLPDPSLMRGMEIAVPRILRALRRREQITVFGDYDVDGATATALLFLFLKRVGAVVDYYVPQRLTEGYGLNIEAIRGILARGTKLIITVDCGISNREEIRFAQENGADVIVTDHHEIPELLPPAQAILNPKQTICPYPYKTLAGVGVAFNLVIGLRTALRAEGFWRAEEVPNLKEYLDLVALGTIADVVPLTGANRILARYGLAQLTQSTRPGIQALKEVSAVGDAPIDPTTIHFRFAPRLNAAGRLGDGGEAIRLLISADPREAREIAGALNNMNTLRQQIEAKILDEAREMIEGQGDAMKNAFVLASQNWHPGVIGIVASRLTEEYHRPTILISLKGERGKGSGRSIAGFPLFQGLKACRAWMEKFGGHEQAAGLVIRTECIPGFSRAFEEAVTARLGREDFIPRLPIDAWTRLEQMNESFLSELESLSPFGSGNPEPVLGLEDLTVLDSRLVGKNHLRLRIREGRMVRDAIGFRLGAWHPLTQERMQMALSPQINFFQGRRNLQLRIIDLQYPESENR